MQFFDLTHPLTDHAPTYPGDPPTRLTPQFTLEADGCRLQTFCCGSHSGTHLDAPAHLLADGTMLDQRPISDFFGTALLLDCRNRGQLLGPELLDGFPESPCDFLLLHTGHAAHWGKPSYFERYPILHPALAARLAESGLRGIGLDTPSPDPPDAHALPAHHTLLAGGLLLLENLCGMDRLPGNRFFLTALPLPLTEADGAPARVVAIFL